MDTSSLSGHSQSPDFGLAPGQPLLWSKLVARQGPYSGRQDLRASLIRRSGPLAAGKQAAAALQGRELEEERGTRSGRERGLTGEEEGHTR